MPQHAYAELSLQELCKLAEGGLLHSPDAVAQYHLALRYASGQDVDADDKEAARWYLLAAEHGYADAQANLAWAYAKGLGVPKDEQKAVEWYHLAADQGHANAQLNLGLMYANGLGVLKDEKEAAHWYRLAAEQGDATAQFSLGYMYASGRGVLKDEQEAVRWCRLAADQGDAAAQNNLGRMHETGWSVLKDEQEAVRLYRLAADQGNTDAQANLGRMYENGLGVPKNIEEAIRWYRLAVAQGIDRAQYRLGLIYSKRSSMPEDQAEALRLFQLAADQGNPAAQCSLGWAYEHGNGTHVDYGAAAYWHLRATERGYLDSFNSLGWLHENGLGVDRDFHAAKRLYKTAARKGHKEAAERLARLRLRTGNDSSDSAHAHSFAQTGIFQELRAHPPPQTASLQQNPITAFLQEAFANFVGLATVRDEVFRQASYAQIQKLRAAKGLPTLASPSKHLVFLGNPGTGKTAIARIIASLYHRLGLLESDKLVETDRAGLVGAYVGQTALKTKEVVESALGGVLFIDEAYALANGGERDFGREAIETLLKMMEDHRDELAVIVAGYEPEMNSFINSNPGLASRFNRYIHFPNYTPAELVTIFAQLCKQHSYGLESDAIPDGLRIIFAREIKAQRNHFSNARFVRNLFERVVEAQADRLIRSGGTSTADLQTILPVDVSGALGEELPTAHSSADNFETVMRRLDALIGLEGVKEQVHRLADFVRMQHARSNAGFKVAEGFSQHLVFSGNPGTGKTTVARIIADLYFALGVLPSNHLVEVDRSGLVAGYVGQSAIKTREVIEEAIGGVLFIDEAYALTSTGSHESDFGHEVIDTLVKCMEDFREQFVVIVAGYRDEMAHFIDSNPGLRSRFSRYITFDDYLPKDLVAIFSSLCAKGEYELDADALSTLSRAVQTLRDEGKTSGNGRFVRNLFEKIVEIQSQRVTKISNALQTDLKRLTLSDVTIAVGELTGVT